MYSFTLFVRRNFVSFIKFRCAAGGKKKTFQTTAMCYIQYASKAYKLNLNTMPVCQLMFHYEEFYRPWNSVVAIENIFHFRFLRYECASRNFFFNRSAERFTD